MPLKIQDKQAIVAEVAEVASSAYSAIAAEYRGMTVDEMTALRKQARENGVYLRVVRNTLARRAIEGTDFECMQETLVGPLVLAFSQEDPGAAARLIRDYSKECDKLVVKSIRISGQLMDASELDTLAKMPTYDQAVASLMSVMQAPITKFVQTLNEVPSKFVRTVAAIRDSKEDA